VHIPVLSYAACFLYDGWCRWEPKALSSEAAASFVQVSVGGQMTAAADVSGKVYTWGFGGSKKLGHGSANNELVPRVLQALASVFVTRVTCGHFHVAAVSSVGSIFTWGDGEFGKLGHGVCSSASSRAFCS
jgi:alpha-tubulin suppressor-like RCC1 family protein